ncbi:RNA polymerase sigma factor [Paraconexibacter antarcticus]|uniref:RNA polymerase sigma factor n=1 Tax=Paraconexibacter antarcticus TaxID=2949664 RepID=A0ABY5DUL4_9ACTN|nr:RNA polymerase sigma factor [Paraconexibacter antarcticus]UTI64993.1 RNA polymerase sigma factor [Paraconexibacter antarcticus]
MGDPPDFAAVYDRWMSQLTRYCRGLTRSEADAEDAAQNAMLKAMAALRRGPAPEQLQPWLHRIAHNEAISLMRRRGTAGAAVPTDVLPDVGGPSLEEVAAVRGRLQEMLGDLRALAPRQREALMLRELEGRSYREIAQVLDVSEAAAQQTVFAARRSLQDCDAGRALDCEPVQRWLSAHEHALVRTRRVRAHLRDCDGCRGFQAALDTRPRDLRLLLPGGTGAGLVGRLLGLLGGGSGVAAKAVVGAGLAATATATAGLLAIAPAPARRAGLATRRPAVAATPAREATPFGAAGRIVPVAPSRHAASGASSRVRATGGHRLAVVKVPARSAHGTGPLVVAPASRPAAPAADEAAPAATSSSASTSAPAPPHPSAPAPAPPAPAPAPSSPARGSGPASAPPAASVPATPVTPAVTLPLPDPAPAVQATATAVQQAVGAVTTSVAPVVGASSAAVDGLLGMHPG